MRELRELREPKREPKRAKRERKSRSLSVLTFFTPILNHVLFLFLFQITCVPLSTSSFLVLVLAHSEVSSLVFLPDYVYFYLDLRPNTISFSLSFGFFDANPEPCSFPVYFIYNLCFPFHQLVFRFGASSLLSFISLVIFDRYVLFPHLICGQV